MDHRNFPMQSGIHIKDIPSRQVFSLRPVRGTFIYSFEIITYV